MVQTRRKRNSVSYYEADSDEDDEVMERVEQELDKIHCNAAASTSSRKNNENERSKKRAKAAFEMIPEDLLSQILSYLDNVREVSRLSKMSKSLRNAISPELVIRSAVFQGNQTRATAKSLIDEIEKKRVRIPSTFRMLRLLNARLCERGTECFCYNVDKQESGPLIGNSVRPFGMSICAACVHALSASLRNSPSCLNKCEELCKYNFEAMCFPQVEKATGEEIGPIVLFRHLKQIQYSNEWEDLADALKSTVQCATKEAISPEDEQLAQRYVAAHEEALSQYDDHRRAQRKIENDKRLASSAKRAARKEELARPVFQKLQSHMQGYTYETVAMDCEWDPDTGLCTFQHWPSRIALGPLLSGPSSATKQKILHAATSVKGFYCRMASLGFLGDNYQSRLNLWLSTNPNIPQHEQALIRYFAEHKTPESMLQPGYAWQDRQQLERLHEGNRSKMIIRMLSAEDCRDAFAHAVARGTNSRRKQQKRFKLAKHLWTSSNTSRWVNRLLDFSDVDSFGEKFIHVNSRYTAVLQKIIRYKTHPNTRAWLADALASGNFSQSLTPQDAVNTLYEGDFGDFGSAASFSRWREHHTDLVRAAFDSEREREEG